jgi:5'-deoxynucleotidase YfbR-like HD superfamily hydrolase
LVKESVSDHVWGMIAIAIEWVPKLNKEEECNFNLKDVIYSIAIHDLDESLYCDIPRTFKHKTPELRKLINDTATRMLKDSGLDPKIYEDIQELSKHDTVYSIFIKILDVIQAGLKMVSEVELGNSYFKDELCNVIDSLNGLISDAIVLGGNETEVAGMIKLTNHYLQRFTQAQLNA